MCDPISASIAIAVVTTAISTVGQIQGANQANKAVEAQAKVKQHEIDVSTTHELNDRMREARREQGRILVAAGESGVNINSGAIEGLMMDSAMQATLANETSLANRESRKKATDAEANAAMKSKPTLLGAGLQIVAAGASAAQGAGAFKKG